MSGDECAHAFPVPDDFCSGMPFPDQVGERIEIFIPLGRVSDVAAAMVNRIATLSPEFVSIQSGAGLATHEIVAKVCVIA